jgi:hypothetical protein
MDNEFSLYTHKQLVQEIKEAFDYNKKSGDIIFEKYKQFLDKYPSGNKIFNLSSSTTNALNQAFQLMNAVNELSKNIRQIESKKFESRLTTRFIELGAVARELYFYHRKSFHENEEEWNDVREKLPENHANLVINYFYAEVSDHIHYMELLNDYGYSLKRYEGGEILNNNKNIEINSSINKFWVTKEKDIYYYDGSPVYIRSKNAEYSIIFDVVYLLKPEGGEINYKDIISLCKKRKLTASVKSIQRALSGDSANFFRYVKGIKQYSPHKVPLFVSSQDKKHIQFNNKK